MKRYPFHDSSTIPLGEFYIERPVDRKYVEGLRTGIRDVGAGPVHLHGSRQCGKSSLMYRASESLKEDHVVAYVDLAGAFPTREIERGGTSSLDFWDRLAGAIAFELDIDIQAFRDKAAAIGFSNAVADLARRLDKPLILIFDELDVLGIEFRTELCGALRALMQRRNRDPELLVNFSLAGVEPPIWTDDSPLGYMVERAGEKLYWLDDFVDRDDSVAKQIRSAFQERADPPISIPLDAARQILAYAGGYPQAISWVGNRIADAVWAGEMWFDQSFPQRLRELAAQYFSRATQQSADVLLQQDATKGWLRTLENYFMSRPGVSEGALEVYAEVLAAAEDPARPPVSYEAHEPEHQLVRFSGLGRRDADNKIRLRAPIFADAFGRAWIGEARQRLSTQQRRQMRRRRVRTGPHKSLLIIGTGGTIGMSEDREGQVRPDDERPEWIRQVEDLLGVEPHFQRAFDLDSADVGPKQWRSLTRRILKAQGKYDGIVVAHGTDTMAYTASAVAFALGSNLGFPVVFTGSQTTTDVLHGDAISNILRAALVALEDLPEVVVSFGEKIFRATRTQKKDDLRFDAFESPGYPELGFVAEEVQIFRQSLLPKSAPPGAPLSKIPAEFASGILHVSQMPGSEAAFYQSALRVLKAIDNDELVGPAGPNGASGAKPKQLCRAIIIQSLGAGNIPTVTPEFDLRTLIREADDRSIPVVLTSQYPVLPANYLRYSPSAAAIKAGAIPTGNMTISAVVAKLSWVIPQVDREIEEDPADAAQRVNRVREMMRKEYVGEGGLTVFDTSDRKAPAVIDA